jgi:hypothetical protein
MTGLNRIKRLQRRVNSWRNNREETLKKIKSAIMSINEKTRPFVAATIKNNLSTAKEM